jgi:hypothetical protein
MEVRRRMEESGGGGGGNDEKKTLTLLSPPHTHTRTQQVVPCFGEDGSYADWDAVNALWEHAFT